MSPVSRRKAGVASSVVVAVAVASLTVFAVRSQGETVHEADLNDGGVWVSSNAQGKFAKLNKPAGQFDLGVTPTGAGLDVLQDGSAVLGLTRSTNQVLPIDPRTGVLDEAAGTLVPATGKSTNLTVFTPSTVDLRGGTVATIDPQSGKVWAQRVDARGGIKNLGGLSPTGKPLMTVGGVAALAVDVRGGVHAVSAATGKVVSIAPVGDGFGTPHTDTIKIEAKAVDITAVGTRWVVYNPVDDLVYAQDLDEPQRGGVSKEEGQLAYAALQQPGPEAPEVGLQDVGGLSMVGIDGSSTRGGVKIQDAPAEGVERTVSRPLRLGRCVHAAWAEPTVARYGANCGTEKDVPAITLEDIGKGTRQDGVRLRTNRGLVVLNDLDTGGLWDLDSKPIKIDNWEDLTPPTRADDKQKNKDENLVDDRTIPQPPKAVPDNLKARPGRTSKLHVLDNDTDTTGAILAIAPGDVSPPTLDGVRASVAADGQSIDVTIPADPDGTAFSFTYKVNNGTAAKKSQAKVTVTLATEDEETAPRLRPGTSKLANTQYPVVAGQRLPLQVVGDWRDGESDPLSVEAADEASTVDGLGRLNVQAGTKRGSQSVGYVIDDGHGQKAQGRVTLTVLVDGDPFRKPQTQPDVVRGIVGKPLQIEPLGNDIPGADPDDPDARMRLSSELRSTGALKIDSNLDTGVVTITATAAGTFELPYGAQVGAGVAGGRIRVDMAADADPDAPPVAVPDSATVRDQTPVLADVLANDYSPRADVLVTQSVSVSSDNSWLRPSIYKGRWVRVEALDPLIGGTLRTGTVTYRISDGTKSTTGEIAVSQKPALTGGLPIVEDDTAVVRAQDTVTINALDNDTMAEGIPLVLNPDSVKVLGGAKQSAFASGNVIRYVPEDRNPTTEQVRTIEYGVYPIGMKEKEQTGRVTVTVKPLPSATAPNLPPVARSFSASVVAGEPLTITVPTSGVDPDGDSVTVQGIEGNDSEAVELNLGRVSSFGTSTIKYEAYPQSAGTEVLNYEIADRFGEKSTGFIRIGVVPPADPQPPVAVEDEVRAAPGKTVSVDVTENDLIARGDAIDLDYKDINDAGDLSAWKVDEPNTRFTTTVPGDGARTLSYGISNGLFDPSRSSVTVLAVPGFQNPPIAVDDVAKPKAGETTSLVDALANDRDIDGPAGSLKVVDVLSPDGVIENGQVRVRILDHPHSVPYVIEDQDGNRAMALIFVPTGADGAPFVVSGALISMDKDSTKTVTIGDYVKSPRSRVVGITSSDTLSASPTANLSVELQGKDTLVLTSSHGYVGPAAVMLEVTDQESADQKDFRAAYVSVPVQIGPAVALLRCPDYAVSLVAAGRARQFDIPTLCHAWVPPGMTLDKVAFDTSWEPSSKGVELRLSGTGDRDVSVKASADAPSSTNGRLKIQARGSDQKPSFVRVSVLGLTKNAVAASAGSAGSAPGSVPQNAGPPRMRPFAVKGLKAGTSRTINLRGYLDSPLEKPQCRIESAAPISGAGLSLRQSGCELTVSASQDAKGSGAVSVSVSDAPGRNATGRGTVEILGRPGAPTGVSAVADRVNGGSARVSWVPPGYDGGTPISRYTVRWKGGSSGSQPCSASPCTITGLTNGATYTFTVSATNGVGEGDQSRPSGPVKPDTKPNAVNGVRMVSRGDGTLTIGWTQPATKGSAITRYIVRVTDTQSGAVKQPSVVAPTTRVVVSGVTNDHVQTVQVRAVNGAGPGPFGSAVKMQSAGTPPAVGAPTITPRAAGTYTTNQVKISWGPTTPNGPPLTKYTVYRRVDGGAWSALRSTSPSTRSVTDSVDFNGSTYSYVVTATNGAAKESAQANAASTTSVAPPLTPEKPRVSTPDNNLQASVTVGLNDSRGRSYTSLQWRTNNGGSGTVACSCPENAAKSFTIGGVGNNSQTLQVRVTNGTSWSAWSTASNAFQPYGPTKTPTGLSSSRNGNSMTWQWNLPTNGRPITQVEVRGDFAGSHGRITSLTRNGSPGQSYRLSVRAFAGKDWSAWTAFDTQAIPAPQPSVAVFKGNTCNQRSCATGNGSCSSPSCAWIAVRTADFGGAVNCTFRANGQTVNGWRGMSIGGNATKESDNFYGVPGDTVSATCGGVTDTVRW